MSWLCAAENFISLSQFSHKQFVAVRNVMPGLELRLMMIEGEAGKFKIRKASNG